ncbi:MAG TPA: hypothetical protein VE988_11035 [Gemmataceae bacterium]|nr:hypothetical protein [Gemmataceae bacterium]
MTTLRKARPKKKTPHAMPVVLRNIPPGYDWGWYSREDPRMHLQTVDERHKNDHKVWLENGGRRAVEVAKDTPAKILKSLRAAIAVNRQTIEDRWASFMIRQGWLAAHLAAPFVTLVAYPGTPNSFARVVDLRQHLLENEAMGLVPKDIKLSAEMSSLQIWPHKPPIEWEDIRLSTILWED